MSHILRYSLCNLQLVLHFVFGLSCDESWKNTDFSENLQLWGHQNHECENLEKLKNAVETILDEHHFPKKHVFDISSKIFQPDEILILEQT